MSAWIEANPTVSIVLAIIFGPMVLMAVIYAVVFAGALVMGLVCAPFVFVSEWRNRRHNAEISRRWDDGR